jgi:hypothetical protein
LEATLGQRTKILTQILGFNGWRVVEVPLRQAGIDEKYLGRRHSLEAKFITIVSNLETGEPVWIGYGRSEATVKQWLDTLTARQKKAWWRASVVTPVCTCTATTGKDWRGCCCTVAGARWPTRGSACCPMAASAIE